MTEKDPTKGSGVLIAVHNSIICSELFTSNNTELIAVKIHHNQRSIIISAFYRPPSLQDMTYTEKIRNDFVHLKTLAKHNSLWIAGDFNLPDINWNKMTIEGSTYPNHINKSFVDIVQDVCMEHIVDFPTRLDNTLDLVFTTHRSLVNKCKPLPGISDHDIVLVDTNIRINRTKQTKRKIYLWKSTNMDELRTEVQTTLNDFMAVSFLTIDNMWTAFKDILLNAMEKHVPSKLSRSKQTYPWITTEVREQPFNLKGRYGFLYSSEFFFFNALNKGVSQYSFLDAMHIAHIYPLI